MLPTHPWSIAQEVGANIEHVAPGPLSSGFHGDPMKLLEDNAPHAQPPRCNKRQPASERYELSSSTSVHLCPLKKNMPSRMPRAIQCQSDIGIEKLQRHCKRPVPAWDSETSSGPAAPNYGELPGTGKLKESPYKIHTKSSKSAVFKRDQKRIRLKWFARSGSLTPDPKAWLQLVLPVVLPRVAESTMSLPGPTQIDKVTHQAG